MTATSRPCWLAFSVALVATFIAVGCLRSEPVITIANNTAGELSAEESAADAILRNGPIFEDWPKPDVAIVFSGELDGYLEPCGCAGLENQKGGLKRRHTFLQQLESEGWPVVSLDMGGQIRRVGPQSEIKYRYALQGLIDLGYSTIGLGARELQLDSSVLIYVLSNFDPTVNPVASANVVVLDPDLGLTSRYRIVEVGGKKIGVTSVLGNKHEALLQNTDDIHWTEPDAALREVLPKLKNEQCDLLVLMVHADPEEATALAKEFPEFQIVATTGGAEEPPHRADNIDGLRTQLIEVGHKGMYAVVLGIYNDPQQPFRYQRVPLDHRFQDSPDMHKLMADYQTELKDMGLDGLGSTEMKHPTDSFVGTETCAECHTEAAAIFENTGHSHATKTLVDLEPQRHYDPECLSCHVTGWNPQEYFPYASGYMGLKKTPHLTDNGCENCHGPGASHVAAEQGEVSVDDAEIESRRAAMRMKLLDNEGNKEGQKLGTVVENCMQCHDLDNSPEFDFQKYWPKVEHYGKD